MQYSPAPEFHLKKGGGDAERSLEALRRRARRSRHSFLMKETQSPVATNAALPRVIAAKQRPVQRSGILYLSNRVVSCSVFVFLFTTLVCALQAGPRSFSRKISAPANAANAAGSAALKIKLQSESWSSLSPASTRTPRRPDSRRTRVTRRSNRDHPLRLQGQVLKVDLEREGQQQVYHLKLKLEFANTGERPRILLVGTYGEKNEWWVRDIWLSRSREDAVAGKSFSSRSVGPANSQSLPKWRQLRRRLRTSTPPPSLTRIIKPHEKYIHYLETFVVLSDDDKISSRSTIWLQLALELWPFNLEQAGTGSEHEFSNRLKERWKQAGELWREPVLSAPIRLDLGEYHIAERR